MSLWTPVLALLTIVLLSLLPYLKLSAWRKTLGLTLFLELFYIVGYYLFQWPYPTPAVLLQLFIISGLGISLGIIFSRLWPLPPQAGFERIIRTFLLAVPALGLGVGLQVLLQGRTPTQALYLIFALAAWLGSGMILRKAS